MDSNAIQSSGHLVDNLDYLMGLSADIYAMTLYTKVVTRRGDESHAYVHDALRAILLKTSEVEITAHVGNVAYAAMRIGDDQYVVCWRTGSDIAKSRVRAVKRAIKRKVPPTNVPRVLDGRGIAA